LHLNKEVGKDPDLFALDMTGNCAHGSRLKHPLIQALNWMD